MWNQQTKGIIQDSEITVEIKLMVPTNIRQLFACKYTQFAKVKNLKQN